MAVQKFQPVLTPEAFVAFAHDIEGAAENPGLDRLFQIAGKGFGTDEQALVGKRRIETRRRQPRPDHRIVGDVLILGPDGAQEAVDQRAQIAAAEDLIGVLVASWLWSRRHRRHFFDTMDFLAPLVPPGLGFGRIGNYIGGELWGKYTEGGWGVVFPGGLPEPYRSLDPAALKAQFDAGALDAFARHPSQLYQAFLEGLVMFCVLWWYSSKPRPRYAVSGLFALLYGSFRFLVEFVRMPDAHLGYLALGWLTMGQVLSLPLVVLGLFLLWRSRSAPVLQPQPIPSAKETKR